MKKTLLVLLGAAAIVASAALVAGRLEPFSVAVGISDGTYTELLSELPPRATQLVASIETGGENETSSSPLAPGPPGMPPPPPPGPPPTGGPGGPGGA